MTAVGAPPTPRLTFKNEREPGAPGPSFKRTLKICHSEQLYREESAVAGLIRKL